MESVLFTFSVSFIYSETTVKEIDFMDHLQLLQYDSA